MSRLIPMTTIHIKKYLYYYSQEGILLIHKLQHFIFNKRRIHIRFFALLFRKWSITNEYMDCFEVIFTAPYETGEFLSSDHHLLILFPTHGNDGNILQEGFIGFATVECSRLFSFRIQYMGHNFLILYVVLGYRLHDYTYRVSWKNYGFRCLWIGKCFMSSLVWGEQVLCFLWIFIANRMVTLVSVSSLLFRK